MQPKPLKQLQSAGFTTVYDPSIFRELTDLINKRQDITLKYGRPFFLFSKQGMAYIVEETVEFQGYISSFEPINVKCEEAEVAIQITPLK